MNKDLRLYRSIDFEYRSNIRVNIRVHALRTWRDESLTSWKLDGRREGGRVLQSFWKTRKPSRAASRNLDNLREEKNPRRFSTALSIDPAPRFSFLRKQCERQRWKEKREEKRYKERLEIVWFPFCTGEEGGREREERWRKSVVKENNTVIINIVPSVRSGSWEDHFEMYKAGVLNIAKVMILLR